MEGKLGGTGRMVILPVDQGFEHGPARSFAPNPAAYDPHYHFELAIEAGLNAYAAPLGMIEAGAATFAGAIPTILKVNSSNSLSTTKDQAVTGSVADALRLGCSAIGFTIYPSSEYQFEMMEELRELAEEAKSAGLAVVVWSYPRGPMLDKTGETAFDICAYAAHMAALLGAPHHQGEAADRRRCRWMPRRRSTSTARSTGRTCPPASATSCSPASTGAAWWCSRAARRRVPMRCSMRRAPSMPAAATAPSSAATPSSARRMRR